jgi:hypothetical protein
MRRPAQPEEIAPAFVFLAAPSCSSYITGEILPIIVDIQARDAIFSCPMARTAKRKYARSAGEDVKGEMHRYKHGNRCVR